MLNAPSSDRGSALRAARVGAARIGALLLDLTVALADPDRAPAAYGLLQDSALERRSLAGKGLDDLTGTFLLEFPLLGLVIVRKRESGQLCHARISWMGMLIGPYAAKKEANECHYASVSSMFSSIGRRAISEGMNRLFPETGARAWQRMLSGRRLDLLNPSPLDIEIEDIAHGLA